MAILVLLSGNLLAQISEIRIDQKREQTTHGARLKDLGPITLPFWDDFSTSTQQVDTNWWDPNSQVQVIARPGIGINPPSLNVVTFDGVDAIGNPYSAGTSDGYVDSLISRKIDLTRVQPDLRNSVFLSFYYQAKGLGEAPEELDSLILYMRRADSTWRKVWPLPNDPYNTNPNIFTEKFIQVADPAYYHEGFQFMFRAIGRQNGWFDNWHIDYVYMDKRRTLGDNSYLDRAYTSRPSTFLGDYTALPLEEYIERVNNQTLLTPSSASLRNLENDFQPVEYTATIADTFTQTVLDTILFEEPLLMFPKDLQELTSNTVDAGAIPQDRDSMLLEVKYWVNSGDKNLIDSIYNGFLDTAFYDHIDLRVNDTVRNYVSIHDHFAYDDGSAEVGAGINQRFGRLAYQFVAEGAMVLNRIDAFFPNTDRNQAGAPIEIFVLRDLDETPESTRAVISTSVQHTGIDEFVSYNINPPVMVADTFYIGFRHLDNDERWISIGLDKNTDTGSKIYSNITGVWVQNQTVSGSLMLRPYFTNGPVTSISETFDEVKIYPNPSSGAINIVGEFDQIEVFDTMGRVVEFTNNEVAGGNMLNLRTAEHGLVIIRLWRRGQIITRKVLVKPN